MFIQSSRHRLNRLRRRVREVATKKYMSRLREPGQQQQRLHVR